MLDPFSFITSPIFSHLPSYTITLSRVLLPLILHSPILRSFIHMISFPPASFSLLSSLSSLVSVSLQFYFTCFVHPPPFLSNPWSYPRPFPPHPPPSFSPSRPSFYHPFLSIPPPPHPSLSIPLPSSLFSRSFFHSSSFLALFYGKKERYSCDIRMEKREDDVHAREKDGRPLTGEEMDADLVTLRRLHQRTVAQDTRDRTYEPRWGDGSSPSSAGQARPAPNPNNLDAFYNGWPGHGSSRTPSHADHRICKVGAITGTKGKADSSDIAKHRDNQKTVARLGRPIHQPKTDWGTKTQGHIEERCLSEHR